MHDPLTHGAPRTARFLLAVVLLALPAQAWAQHDISLWGRRTLGDTQASPWYVFAGSFVANVRYNFDAQDTAGACLGKGFGTSVVLVPEACGYFGEMSGFGPEVLVFGDWPTATLFMLNQYVRGLDGNPHYAYTWTSLLGKATPSLRAGADLQAFRMTGFSQVDAGPSFRVLLGPAYLHAWQAWSLGPENRGRPMTFVGMGYVR
jgi:hypothetical protein